MTQREQEHKAIWLAPWCDKCERDFYYPESCRTWCQDDAFDPCDECGALSVKYVLATDQPSADGESMRDEPVKCFRYQGDMCESPDCVENGCPWGTHEQKEEPGQVYHAGKDDNCLHPGPRKECKFFSCQDEQSAPEEDQ